MDEINNILSKYDEPYITKIRQIWLPVGSLANGRNQGLNVGGLTWEPES